MLCSPDVDNFYFTDEELADSPSRRDGMDEETETALRVFGAQLVQEATILMACPQAVAATGQVLLQRFYCKRSFKHYSVKKLAAAVTFLATKLEECTNIRMRDVIMVFDRLYRRKEGASARLLEPGTNEYSAAKDAIIRYERDVLRVLGFIVHTDPPHKLLVSLLKVLDGDKRLVQEAWNIANDSLRTTLCVRFRSNVIAAGIIFYAARRLQVPLPEKVDLPDAEDPVSWWQVVGVETQQLVAVVSALHALYLRPKPNIPALLRAAGIVTAAARSGQAVGGAAGGMTPPTQLASHAPTAAQPGGPAVAAAQTQPESGAVLSPAAVSGLAAVSTAGTLAAPGGTDSSARAGTASSTPLGSQPLPPPQEHRADSGPPPGAGPVEPTSSVVPGHGTVGGGGGGTEADGPRSRRRSRSRSRSRSRGKDRRADRSRRHSSKSRSRSRDRDRREHDRNGDRRGGGTRDRETERTARDRDRERSSGGRDQGSSRDGRTRDRRDK